MGQSGWRESSYYSDKRTTDIICAIPYSVLLAMTITVGQYITGIITVNAENGVHGTEDAGAIFGSVIVLAATVVLGMKKEQGGILPGTILYVHANNPAPQV